MLAASENDRRWVTLSPRTENLQFFVFFTGCTGGLSRTDGNRETPPAAGPIVRGSASQRSYRMTPYELNEEGIFKAAREIRSP